MSPDEPSKEQQESGTIHRRRVLKTVGGIAIVGTGSSGLASARGPPNDNGNPSGKSGPPSGNGGGPPNGDDNGPPDRETGDRTIDWEGQGSEHATQECDGAVGYWHWILTPGGPGEFEDVGELVVTFEDGTEQSVSGYRNGNGRGAYHFDVRNPGGGTVENASVQVIGGGRNALLTISDGECVDGGVVYWQVDFGEGAVPEPPRYWPDDVMAALGNSNDGVTNNPSIRRQETDGQLGDVDIVGNQFTFDDDGNPTEVTVEFEVEAGGETRDLHLASFVLPGEYDDDEIDEQELYDSTKESFAGGESGELTIGLPQQT